MTLRHLILALGLGMAVGPVLAGDLASDVRKGASRPTSNDGNFIEVGVGFAAGQVPVYGIPEGNTKGENISAGYLDINARVQYKGFFLEAFSQSMEEFTFGYNISNSDVWSMDVVALEEHMEMDSEENKDYKGLKTRRGDFMFGPRMTGYFGKYIAQFHMLTDVSGTHNGQVYSAKIARHWQYKNWNYHVIVGTSYRTEKVADYYMSVKPEDANEKFHAFDADAGFTNVIELGVTYPLSQKWVFRGLIRHGELDEQWAGSPLIVETHPTIIATSISYVF